jgi:hypothetical protein
LLGIGYSAVRHLDKAYYQEENNYHPLIYVEKAVFRIVLTLQTRRFKNILTHTFYLRLQLFTDKKGTVSSNRCVSCIGQQAKV